MTCSKSESQQQNPCDLDEIPQWERERQFPFSSFYTTASPKKPHKQALPINIKSLSKILEVDQLWLIVADLCTQAKMEMCVKTGLRKHKGKQK